MRSMDPSRKAAGGGGRWGGECTSRARMVERGLSQSPVGWVRPLLFHKAWFEMLGKMTEKQSLFVRERPALVRKVPVQVGVCWRKKPGWCQAMDGFATLASE